MNAACLAPPTELPEWRRSGRFFAIAVVLHGLALIYPLHRAVQQLEIPPPATLMVQLAAAVKPVAPTPVAVQPAAPQSFPKELRREKPSRPTPPVLAMPAASAAESNFAVPAVAAPPGNVSAAATNVAPAPTLTTTPARFDAAYLHNPRPAYPPLSRRLGEEGKVLLRVRVSVEGLPLTVDIEKSSNFPRLDEAARQVVTRWRFVPAKRGEEGIEATVIVPVVFKLDD